MDLPLLLCPGTSACGFEQGEKGGSGNEHLAQAGYTECGQLAFADIGADAGGRQLKHLSRLLHRQKIPTG